MNHHIKNEIGNRYGRLVVTDYAYKTKGMGCYWKCKCDCGNEIIACGVCLRSCSTKSCGCYRRENFQKVIERKKQNAKYQKPSRIRSIWGNMIYRCYNKNSIGYNNYGGRGIAVCKDWLSSFESFKSWALSNGYADNLTIDRIDVNGNYEPSNCRWISQKEQLRNKRGTIYIEYNGEKKPLIEFCEELGVPYERAIDRIRRGKTDSAEILSKEKLPFKLTENGRKRRAEGNYVPYSLEKDGMVRDFKSEKDACKFLGVSRCSVSKAYSQGRKLQGYIIHKLESFPDEK